MDIEHITASPLSNIIKRIRQSHLSPQKHLKRKAFVFFPPFLLVFMPLFSLKFKLLTDKLRPSLRLSGLEVGKQCLRGTPSYLAFSIHCGCSLGPFATVHKCQENVINAWLLTIQEIANTNVTHRSMSASKSPRSPLPKSHQ